MVVASLVAFRCTAPSCPAVTATEFGSVRVTNSTPIVIASSFGASLAGTAVVNFGASTLNFSLYAFESIAATYSSTAVSAPGDFVALAAFHDVVMGDDGLPMVFQSSTTQGHHPDPIPPTRRIRGNCPPNR